MSKNKPEEDVNPKPAPKPKDPEPVEHTDDEGAPPVPPTGGHLDGN